MRFLIAAAILVSVLFAQQEETVKFNEDFHVKKITENVYVHISWDKSRMGRFSSNGMVYINDDECIVVDTPTDSLRSLILIDWLEKDLGKKVAAVTLGHWHFDCMGGLGEFHRRGIPSYSCQLTADTAVAKNLPVPQNTFTGTLNIQVGKSKAVCFYPGPGHTVDNIVVYMPETKAMFGGCLIRNEREEKIRFGRGSYIEEWDRTVKNIKSKFTDVEFIVPGHGPVGGGNLLDHTIKLVGDYKENN